MSMRKCKKQLTVVWFSGGGLVFILLFFQTILGHYESGVSQAWGWALPTIMPTLSLIIGVLVSDALGISEVTKKTTDQFVFWLAIWLSVAYLASVLLTILFQPFSGRSPIEVFVSANLWLGPFQGLVVAALGAFFVREGKK